MLEEKASVSINIFSITGEKIRSVVNAEYERGNYNVSYDVDANLEYGIYFIENIIDSQRSVTKLIVN